VDLFKYSETNGVQNDFGLKLVPTILALKSGQLSNETSHNNGMMQHGYSLDMMDLKACPKWTKFLKPQNNDLFINSDWSEDKQLLA